MLGRMPPQRLIRRVPLLFNVLAHSSSADALPGSFQRPPFHNQPKWAFGLIPIRRQPSGSLFARQGIGSQHVAALSGRATRHNRGSRLATGTTNLHRRFPQVSQSRSFKCQVTDATRWGMLCNVSVNVLLRVRSTIDSVRKKIGRGSFAWNRSVDVQTQWRL